MRDQETAMIEAAKERGCSILHTLEIRLGLRVIIGAWSVLLFVQWRDFCWFAGRVLQQEVKNGLACLCDLLFLGDSFW
jgi:hypothetical protein